MLKEMKYKWEKLLKDRLSRIEVGCYARRLHNDEHGIFSLYNALITTNEEKVTFNAAWILSHLSKSDKEMYLMPYYDKIANLAMLPELNIRRGLILSILVDMPLGNNLRIDLLDFCIKGMFDRKESDSTRSVMIKFTAKMCKSYPELKNELIESFRFLSEEMKPSISTASRKALQLLK